MKSQPADNTRRFRTVNEYNLFNNIETRHPLVSVIDFSKASPRAGSKMEFGFYAILLKDVKCGDLVYGRHEYDYQEGTLVFFAPGQTAGMQSDEVYQPRGFGIVFHEDFLEGTPLGRHIHEYTFFGYQSNEALHLSERERSIILDCFNKIDYELEHAIDKHSRKLIAANIELLLNYCARFYDRQFITRDTVHGSIMERFSRLANDYFDGNLADSIGLPSVAHFARELCISPGYLGDLVKKETGKTAQEFLHSVLIDIAKQRIVRDGKSIREIAFDLGFKYPQHFVRLFKQRVGQTPTEYRSLN